MIFIGIDPGSVKTGIGIWDNNRKMFHVRQFNSHCESLFYVNDFTIPNDKYYMVIEDARLFKPNAYLAAKSGDAQKQGAGAVKALSKDWEQFAILKGIAYELRSPASNHTKSTPEYFEKLTGIKTLKTHHHMRDAGLMVYGMKEHNIKPKLKTNGKKAL